MATVHFDEIQHLREKPLFIAMVIGVAFAAIIPLANGIYLQLILGQRWGNQPMSNEGLIALTVFVVAITGFISWMMLNLRLETRIDEQGIHYRMFPVKSNWRSVTPANIKTYSLEKRYKVFESGGMGFHRNFLKNSTSLKMCSTRRLR